MNKRKMCEKAIAEKLMEIKQIYDAYMKECEVDDDYLALTVYSDQLRANNAYWKHEGEGKLDFWYVMQKEIGKYVERGELL